MREIKFRVWNLEAKEMLTVTNLELFENGDVVARHDDGNYQFGALVSHPKSDVFLMQYTGLKDKNGKEIYEGDIVTGGVVYGWKNETGLAIVRFGEFDQDGSGGEYSPSHCCGWYLDIIHQDFGLGERVESLYEEPTKHKHITIIGNIYSNPELLTSLERG